MTDLTATKPSPLTGRKRPNFSREQVERALIALAYANGCAAEAVRMLEEDEEQGFKVDAKTLARWKNGKYAQLYKEVQEQALPEIRRQAAERHMEVADRAMQVNEKVLDRLEANVHDIPARDLPGSHRNLATSTAIHRDKARDLRGETSVPAPTRLDLGQLLRALKAKQVDVDVEVTDAEVVEEKPPAELESANA